MISLAEVPLKEASFLWPWTFCRTSNIWHPVVGIGTANCHFFSIAMQCYCYNYEQEKDEDTVKMIKCVTSGVVLSLAFLVLDGVMSRNLHVFDEVSDY